MLAGLGLGVGYNRELLPPADINKLPQFLLVEALDDPGAVWRVTSGQVDVFYSRPDTGQDRGRRRHAGVGRLQFEPAVGGTRHGPGGG